MNIANKIVLITGASSGIGLACAQAFAKAGCHLLLCARRYRRLEDIADQLRQEHKIRVCPFQLDVGDYQAVQNYFAQLAQDWQPVDILINNAGLALGLENIDGADYTKWERMIDTNVKGLLYMTQSVIAQMRKQNSGHIINIGSISGHEVYAGGTVYCATKFAVKAISDGLKKELHGTPIRVSSVDPGLVETEFSLVRFAEDAFSAAAVYSGLQPLQAQDVADAVLYCATRPAHVDIREMKIYPTCQSAAHLIDRQK